MKLDGKNLFKKSSVRLLSPARPVSIFMVTRMVTTCNWLHSFAKVAKEIENNTLTEPAFTFETVPIVRGAE